MNNIASHWWLFAVRGITSLALAVLLLLGPHWSSGEAIAAAFAIYAFVDGAAALGFVAGAQNVRKATYITRGLLGIAAGALALTQPFASTLGLYLLAGSWGIVTGALEMAFGSRAWSAVPMPRGFMLAGAVSFGFGLTLLCFPLEGVETFRAFFAAFGVMNGAAALALSDGLHHAPALRMKTA